MEPLAPDDSINRFLRSEQSKAVRNVIIGEVIVSVVWGLLGRVIPSSGTLMAVVNIAFLALSLLLGWMMAMNLRYRFSSLASGAIAAVVWVLVFGVLRGLF